MEYVLDFLRQAYSDGAPADTPQCEYRLLCSGELYNSAVLTADYRKTDAPRFLHTRGFELMVASNQYDDYPQELLLSIPVEMVDEGTKTARFSFRPDGTIADDLAALLTLYVRRLVTVAGKVRTRWPGGIEGLSPTRYDWPEPVVGTMKEHAWARRSASLIYRKEGVEVQDHRPPPVPLDDDRFQAFLHTVTLLKHSESYLASVRTTHWRSNSSSSGPMRPISC